MVDDILDDVMDLLKDGKGDPVILGRIRRAAEHDEVISIHERNYVKRLAYKKPEPETIPVQPKPIVPVPAATAAPQAVRTRTRRDLKSTKIVFLAGVAVLAILLVAGLSSDIEEPPPEVPPESALTIRTDANSYSLGDIISITGVSKGGGIVEIVILNPAGDEIWRDEAEPKTDGAYSTLAIAGGRGWERTGTYSITMEIGGNSTGTTFEFNR